MDEQKQELAAVTFDADTSILSGSTDLKKEAFREKMKVKREAAVAAGVAKKKRVVKVTVGNLAPPFEDGPGPIADAAQPAEE